jgi:amino acid adenylation domain-containing protein/non-ribosomal peptide synthase protein (TIGR01720 family)
MSQVFDKEPEAEVIEGFQLSPQQVRLWTLQQKSAAYRAQLVLAIAGEVSEELLKEALRSVVGRNEILRTLYFHGPGLDGRLQVIQDDCDLVWTKIDLSGLAISEQPARIEELRQSELQFTFDHAHGPLLRVLLAMLSAGEQRLFITLSPLCTDRQSLNNLIEELSRTYSAFVKRETLDDGLTQYLQFSEWQNELLQDADSGGHYWKQIPLDKVLQPIPFEIRSSHATEFEPQFVMATVDATVLERLHTPLRLARIPLSVFMQACWQTLVWRHTRQDEFLLGHVFDGRIYEQLQQSLGLFAKTVPIRCRLHDELSFWELLAQVDEETKQASKWQAYWSWPGAAENDCGTDARAGETPFLALGFEFVEASRHYPAAGLTFSLVTQSLCNELFKLKLYCAHWSDDRSLELEFQFDPQFISNDAVLCLVEQFQQLVGGAAASPARAIGSLSIMSEAELQCLVQRNSTRRYYPASQPWHRLFEEQAKQTPDRIALVSESEQLTYRELNERANRLAHYLRQLGVTPDSAVGLYLNHSASIIVGLLGICKAGGAYVPLDTRQPIARLTRMLETTSARVVVSESGLAKNLPTVTTSVVCLDTDQSLLEKQSSSDPNVQVEMENLAYVIFTSGSTGQPKGVAIEHRQLLNYIRAINDRVDFPVPGGFATVSTIAADLGNTMIYPCLCFGGTLHLISPDRLSDATALENYFAQHEIDCLKIVPSHLEALYRDKQGRILPRSRLIVGGEAPRREFLLSLLEETPDCAIYNHYGPTETTIGVLTARITKDSLENDGPTVALGEPLGNVRIYIFNERMEPAATGETGEIYIGGAGVMRGYIGQPAQTAAKCLPDPCGTQPGGRIYRTGDLARYRLGGDIEFLGRADEQVKLRGFRIELGEIESALREHPSVQDAVVIVNVDSHERKRLIVYVSTPKRTNVTSQELQAFLELQLPEYMLPSHIVVLDALPLTPNGKIDRHALPSPESAVSREKKFVAPETETEKILAEIWSRVLGVERVGIHDNFFELGGDSILNIQVITQANRRGLRLAPKHLFRHQTIAQLATMVGTAAPRYAQQGRVSGPVRLTPMQRLFFENQPVNPSLLNQYVMLKVRSGTDWRLFEQVLQAMLDHHDALRLRFVEEEGEWRQYNAEQERLSFERVDLSGLQGAAQAEAMAQAVQAAQEGLNLSDGPLLRAVYMELGADEEGRLLLVVHHLAVDGVSWRILLEDLQSGYEQLRSGQTVSLPAKTTSYQSWAEQLWQRAQSEELAAEASYWLGQRWEQVGRLRRDYEGGENLVRSARSVTAWLSAAETRVLLREVAEAYHTQINEVLLTGLVRAFQRWSGERVLLVDVEGHGREEEVVGGVDLSRTVGWFTSVYPQRLEVEESESVAQTLKRVKEQVREIPRRGMGYGMLRQLHEGAELREQMRAVGRAEVSFNYLGQFDQVVDAESIFQGAEVSGESAQKDIDARHHLQATQPHICLSVDAMVTNKKLKIMCTYDETQHRQSTIERLLRLLLDELRDLISARQPAAPEILIASDFPQANLTQTELDTFLSSLNRGVSGGSK